MTKSIQWKRKRTRERDNNRMSFPVRVKRNCIDVILVLIIVVLFIRSISINDKKSLLSATLPEIRSLLIDDQPDETNSNLSILCSDMSFTLRYENYLPSSTILHSPPLNATQMPLLTTYYTQWKSSPILPRGLSRCEHSLLIRLLKFVDQICRAHKIGYFIIEGTLLGSLRHHDIIPWDDDIDLIIPEEERARFVQAFEQLNQTLIHLHMMQEDDEVGEYYKLSFVHTPTAGEYRWHFPFVDLFFYGNNETHLWNINEPDVNWQRKKVFPLIMRPFGPLWLPSPRKAYSLFPLAVFDQCKGHFWNHRNESDQARVSIPCDQLKEVYPFVQRTNHSREILRLNKTHLHTVIYD